MQNSTQSRKHLSVFLSFSLLCTLCLWFLSACSSGGSSTPTTKSTSTSSIASNQGASATATAATTNATPPAGVQLGLQPCPAAVSAPSHWDPIVGTQNGVSAVSQVICANLIGTPTLQGLIIVTYSGTGGYVDIYIYNNITSPSPAKLFSLQGLSHGDAKISNYNTIITAEVDQNSSINKGVSNAGLTRDLFREFKWSDGAGTFVPVSFPGIFPDLTRYQAEADQQQVNQGHQPWKLQATMVANTLAVTLLKWSTNASATLVSGGGQHDSDAVVNVKSTSAVPGNIKVTMSRLEGNTNGGIWIVTSVTSIGMAITTPQNRDLLTSPTAVAGKGNAFEGKIGVVTVLDHLYTDIGHASATGAIGNGNTTFSTNVAYTSTFKGGSQEGLLALYSYSNADGSIVGAVFLKELISA